MRIIKVITLNWGTLENREWNFTDTVLLTGESGSGKSTLLDAIQTILTAARGGIFQFNIGQNESSQGRKGGKEPRTLQAYALGQIADDLFLRNRSMTYLAVVFDASQAAGESANPLTAIVCAEAVVEASKAVLVKDGFYVVRRALGLQHFVTNEDAAQPIALKDIYIQLQTQLQVGTDIVQRCNDKSRYLQSLYGAFMGKSVVPEADAFRAAKALVKAMAYKELGNVHDLVREEILDEFDFTETVGELRQLMQTMARLKAEAERLKENLTKLEAVQASSQEVLNVSRRFVVSTIAMAVGKLADLQSTLARTRKEAQNKRTKFEAADVRLEQLGIEQGNLDDQRKLIEKQLEQSDVARQKRVCEELGDQLAKQFRTDWQSIQGLGVSLDALLILLEPVFPLSKVEQLPLLLREAIDRVAGPARHLQAMWHAGVGGAFRSQPNIDSDLPAFEAEALDSLLVELGSALTDGDLSLAMAVVDTLAECKSRIPKLKDEQTEKLAELASLQSGKSPAPEFARYGMEWLEREMPEAEPKMLAQLIEPRKGSDWQNAVEGYMRNARFNLVVLPGFEASATRSLRRKFGGKAASVIQSSKVVADAKSINLPQEAIVHELIVTHPVAKAYLYALYGRVRKVDTEEELAQTSQGLMKSGTGSRSYAMFPCWAEDRELAFGEESRKRRMRAAEARLSEIRDELLLLQNIEKLFKSVSAKIGSVSLPKTEPQVHALLTLRERYIDNANVLASLDTSSITELEKTLRDTRERIENARKLLLEVAGERGADFRESEALDIKVLSLEQTAPAAELAVTNSKAWAIRFVAAAPELASEIQLVTEAEEVALESGATLSAIEQRIPAARSELISRLREVRNDVQAYLSWVRAEDERFAFADPPTSVDRIEDVLRSMLTLRANVALQMQRQNAIGLAENSERLKGAEGKFNAVFTASFCFKVRNDVRDGSNTLQRLNRELKVIRFGYDSYELEWKWIPQFQNYYEFFEAVNDMADSLEKDKTSIFESTRLTPEQRVIAVQLRDLLLTEDEIHAEKALKELSDYRNYRRYDIIRRNETGQSKMSTWGTGSGGELETPFYVLRATVLCHALGHFGRDKAGAPALRLMLSDEAFSKMDETRSRDVLRFLSDVLKLQLVVAMPTSKSGAVKPEFSKEFTFSKIEATRGTQAYFISEAQEKTLKQKALDALWISHADTARLTAKLAYHDATAALNARAELGSAQTEPFVDE
jgi:energy-coupling factor transporter ATP-binding protein EcfA2